MILIDIEELIEEPKITQQRKAGAWPADYKLKFIPDQELRRYFVEQMNQHFGVL